MVDLSGDDPEVIDIEAFLIDCVLMSEVKAEPQEARAATGTPPFTAAATDGQEPHPVKVQCNHDEGSGHRSPFCLILRRSSLSISLPSRVLWRSLT